MRLLFAIFAAIAVIAHAPAANAEPRLALVVGISRYGANSLNNALNDAKIMADALRAVGFKSADLDEKILLDNPSQLETKRAINRLASRAETLGPDTTIVVYLAGHGMKVLDKDYLIPPDSPLLDAPANARDFNDEAVDVEKLLAILGEVPVGRVIFIVDACRTRPAPKDERAAPSARDAGLAAIMNIPTGPDTLIFFAAEPGQAALDGVGRTNGYFAPALVDAIQKPGMQLSELIIDVRERTWNDSKHRQRPFQQGGSFHYVFVEAPPAAPKRDASSSLADDATWSVAKSRNNDQSYAMYLDLYSAGRHAGEARTAIAALAKRPTAPVNAALGNGSALQALQSISKAEWESAERQVIATKVMTSAKLPDLQALAGDGNSKAQFVLATLYEYGAGGVSQNVATATGLYEQAAQANMPAAQYVLGDRYYYGVYGAAKDPAKARDLYLKAAAGGHVVAASRLADIYLGYSSLPKDDSLARKYVVIAAERGEPWAQCRLGVIYQQGSLGYAKDPLKARAWAEKSANQNVYCGQVNLASMYMSGTNGLKVDDAKGFQLYKAAAQSGAPVPLAGLAWCYEFARGTEKNLPEAARLYEKAATQGFGSAQERLGYFYRDGMGVVKDPKTSVRWFETAAAQGLPDAKHELGLAYLYGLGTEKDESRAATLFLEAAAQGHVGAQAAAGVMYENGYGVPKDEVKALSFYEMAARHNNADSQLRLAYMYLQGRAGLPVEPAKGRGLMKQSAAQGYQPAMDWLAAHPDT